MKTSPAELLRQVKQETAKITWPAPKQTTQMTFAVIFMCVIFALFFWVVDGISMYLVRTFLGV